MITKSVELVGWAKFAQSRNDHQLMNFSLVEANKALGFGIWDFLFFGGYQVTVAIYITYLFIFEKINHHPLKN